jgi:hypothetical protein
MKILTTTALLLLFIGTSCCTSGKIKNKDEKENTSAMSIEKMTEEGFTSGTIVASQEEGDCPFVIKSEVAGSTVMYDPINLEESFKEDGMKIWYKYRGLRMANRCTKANPVSLEEIQKM